MATWRDRVELLAEVGLRGEAAGEMVWDVSEWDEAGATWSGLEPTFRPLEGCEVESLAVTRGRKTGGTRNQAGTSEVGLVWRNAQGGKWSFRATSPIELGQELRIRALVDGGPPIPIYRGSVRRIRDGWRPDTPTFRVTLQMVDRLADLAAVDLPEAASATGLDDLTHERLARILGLAMIDPFFAVLGTDADTSGVVHHQSSTFARNLLDEAMTTVEGEAGADFLVNREGQITMRRPLWWLPPDVGSPHPRWNVRRLTWSNTDPVEALTFCPLAFGTGQDLDDIRNQVSMARSGGTAITVTDPDSVIRYGLRTYQRFDLTCRYDADVTAAAELRLAELADRTNRVDAVGAELDPGGSTAELEAFVDVTLGDQQAIVWSDGDSTMTGTFHVQGLRLRVDPDHWRLELDLWAYAGLGLEAEAASTWGAGSAWGTSTWQGAA